VLANGVSGLFLDKGARAAGWKRTLRAMRAGFHLALVMGAEVFEDTGGGLCGAAVIGTFRKLGADRANNARPKTNVVKITPGKPQIKHSRDSGQWVASARSRRCGRRGRPLADGPHW